MSISHFALLTSKSQILICMNLQLILEGIILILFAVHIIRVTFLEVFIWQLKEYRLDRFLAYLHTSSGRKLVTNPLIYIKWAFLIVSSIFFYRLDILSLTIGLLFIYFFETMLVARRKLSGFKFPKFTYKAVSITLATFILILATLLTFPLNRLLLIQLLDRLLPFVIVLCVLIASLPTYGYRKLMSFLAQRKIASHPDLLVIGITGSFGKTSTKEFLASILSHKYKVLKTEGSQNTEVAVAQTVNKNLDSSHQIFIVEMGAYKSGEIASICRVVSPQVGIITGINEQHIELFGSIKETMKTKFELIGNLKNGGIAIFNTANKYVKEMIAWTKDERPDLTVWKYQRLDSQVSDTKKDITKKANCIYARDIELGIDYLKFRLIKSGEEVSCRACLVGAGNIDNILASSACAISLGLSLTQIKKSIEKLPSPPQTMKLYKNKHSGMFVDDTFNTNPVGVLSALNYMKLHKGKNVLVLTPLIELGEYAFSIHENLGSKAAQICDLVLLTNSNYYDSFIKGTSKVKNGSRKVHIINRADLDKLLKPYLSKNTMIVFEGKEAKKVMDKLY